MKLQKQHRQSLLNELSKAQEDLSTQRKCLNQKGNENINDMFEISIFLAQKRIELIEQSLIDNEIDF